jgi:DNA-binding FrmR family transcriptional regulator
VQNQAKKQGVGCTSYPSPIEKDIISNIRPDPLAGAILETSMSRIVNAEKKKNLCARLARIEGQLRGLQKLIEADADCEKIAQQMAAARKALDKSFFSMVGCMIEQGDQSPEHVAAMLTKFA